MSKETYLSDTYIERELKEYFKENLTQYVEGDDAWGINWNPNAAFARPDDLYWLDFFFLPGVPFQQELGTGGRNRWTGAMQVNVCVPRNEAFGMGVPGKNGVASALDTCYDDIARVFRRGVTFGGILITRTYRDTSAMQVYDDFCALPVTIEWRADLSN